VLSKVLIITGIFPPNPGGPAKFASSFANWTFQNGSNVKVISYIDEFNTSLPFNGNEFLGIYKGNKTLVRTLKMIKAIKSSAKREDRIIAVGAFLETYVASMFKKFNYVAKVPGDIVWERARNNRVTNLDISEFQNSQLPARYRAFRYLFTKSLRRASSVIVPSEGLFRLCILWGVPESRLRLIKNSVDLTKFSKLQRESFQFDVLTVCRLTPWKGVDELIEACRKLNIRLAIAGDGPERVRLEELSLRHELDVIFFGDVNELKILELLSSSKIFVLNSHYEGLPHALVEARAAGLICVARDGTGSAEVIHDGEDGFLVGKTRNLTEAIRMAMAEFESSSPMGRLASQDARARFDHERNFEKITRVLEDQQS
jgi:glycosyltransferase involved in cell wall biosynthesis